MSSKGSFTEGDIWAYVVRNALLQSVGELGRANVAMLRRDKTTAIELFQSSHEYWQLTQTAWYGLSLFRKHGSAYDHNDPRLSGFGSTNPIELHSSASGRAV